MKQVNERRIVCLLRKSNENGQNLRPAGSGHKHDNTTMKFSTKYERINKHKEA